MSMSYTSESDFGVKPEYPHNWARRSDGYYQCTRCGTYPSPRQVRRGLPANGCRRPSMSDPGFFQPGGFVPPAEPTMRCWLCDTRTTRTLTFETQVGSMMHEYAGVPCCCLACEPNTAARTQHLRESLASGQVRYSLLASWKAKTPASEASVPNAEQEARMLSEVAIQAAWYAIPVQYRDTCKLSVVFSTRNARGHVQNRHGMKYWK